MGEKIRIPADGDSALVRQVYLVTGMEKAATALPVETAPDGRWPGVALCRALIAAPLAEERARISTAALKLAAKAGHDIAKIKGVWTLLDETGRLCLEIELLDLADMAEGG